MNAAESELPPSPPLACIRAHSEKQAMDWSLVLASQGIEAVIERHPDTGVWRLWVTPEEHERAVASIRLYRLENRGWAWQRRLAWPGVLFHWGALLWCWILILIHWLDQAVGYRFESIGAMSSQAAARGEWWRLTTAVSLHADVGHLAANAATGLVVFGLAMARFGAGWAMLVGLLAGTAGNAAGWIFHAKPFIGLGASGMVMGGLGMLTGQTLFLLWESPKAIRQIISGLLGGFLLFVLVGLNPASDVIAHAGGFVAGLLLGAALALMPPRSNRRAIADRTAGALALALFCVAWTLAIVFGQNAPLDHDLPRNY